MLKNVFYHLMLLLLLLASAVSNVVGQSNEAELERVSQRVVSFVGKKKPDWKHEVVTPMYPAKLVLIHDWSGVITLIDRETGENWPVQLRMRVVITQYESVEHAHATIQQPLQRGMLRDAGPKPVLLTIGDEGYKWGFRYNSVVFRRGRYVFNVNGTASPDIGEDDKRGLAGKMAEDLAGDIAGELTKI
ncbi:MAG TPA: hypothetical protein VF528_17940 [Pyrinomonadaceae bacterium]|jgi:hypothetical protein